MYSGLIEVISLLSPTFCHPHPSWGMGIMYTNHNALWRCLVTSSFCTSDAWYIVMSSGSEAEQAWRWGTASAKIPTYHPTTVHLLHLRWTPASYSIPNTAVCGCQPIHSLAPKKPLLFLFFQRWNGFGLKLAPVQRWENCLMFSSLFL